MVYLVCRCAIGSGFAAYIRWVWPIRAHRRFDRWEWAGLELARAMYSPRRWCISQLSWWIHGLASVGRGLIHASAVRLPFTDIGEGGGAPVWRRIRWIRLITLLNNGLYHVNFNHRHSSVAISRQLEKLYINALKSIQLSPKVPYRRPSGSHGDDVLLMIMGLSCVDETMCARRPLTTFQNSRSQINIFVRESL